MKYKTWEYLRHGPFDGEWDVDLRCVRIKLVKVRKEHVCWCSLNSDTPHKIPVGATARFESALVDGEWCSYYVCIPCMDEILSDVYPGSGDKE